MPLVEPVTKAAFRVLMRLSSDRPAHMAAQLAKSSPNR
jgi:hypothetical protein